MDRQGWDPLFRERLARHEDELRWLYMSLYGGDAHAYEYFLQMLRRCFDERSEEMRQIDLSRTETAEEIRKEWKGEYHE